MLFGKKKRRIERVLVVEDEPLVAFDTEHFLEEAGFAIAGTFDRVSDAVQALAADAEIDLVLVDVSLADGSGIAVAQAAFDREILVLFVTGSSPGEARALAAGWLSKPYPQRDLLTAIDAIEAVLDGKAPRKLPAGFTLFRTDP